MKTSVDTDCIAFLGEQCIASGTLGRVCKYLKEEMSPQEIANVLIFDTGESRIIDLDLRGSTDDVLQRLEPPEESAADRSATKKRGRPKLGVVAREVTLLPRHWQWLSEQPGGASVALRKLVEAARRGNGHQDQVRAARESAYRFMSAMGGNLPGFEEATRALFAGEPQLFAEQIAPWPKDIHAHVEKLAQPAFRNPRTRRDQEK